MTSARSRTSVASRSRRARRSSGGPFARSSPRATISKGSSSAARADPSGEWLAIRRTPAEELLLTAFRWRALYRVGVRPWHRVAIVGLVSTENARAVRAVSRALTTLGVFRKTTEDCRQEPARLAEALRDLRPDVVLGLPGAISSAATEMGASGGLRGRLVVTGGEVLTPLMRRQIAEGFGARVADVYGSHEFRTIAWECRATGEYHTSDDSLVVEVVTDGRPAAPASGAISWRRTSTRARCRSFDFAWRTPSCRERRRAHAGRRSDDPRVPWPIGRLFSAPRRPPAPSV